MFDVKRVVEGSYGQWVVTNNDVVLFKTCDIGKANKFRERLIESFILDASYIDKETTKLKSFKWCIRDSLIYIKLILDVAGNEKIFYCKHRHTPDEEIEEMKACGIDTEKLFEVISHI